MEYDLIIAGMGISGLTAAIYAKNSGLNVLLIEKDSPGGLLNKISEITNYPGFKKISGPDLSYQLFETISDLHIPYKIETIKDISLVGDVKKITTDKNIYTTKYLILATGRTSRSLGLENESSLLGRGISTCAICDASLYKDKTIAVVGGADSAVQGILYLANYAKKIYVIYRGEKLRASADLVSKLSEKSNITYMFNSNVTKLNTENGTLNSIEINNQENIKVDGLFTFIGFIPNIDFIKNLNITNNDGYIEVDKNYETSVSGIFAIGDCIKKSVYQLVTGASEGAIAALEVYNLINKSIDKNSGIIDN